MERDECEAAAIKDLPRLPTSVFLAAKMVVLLEQGSILQSTLSPTETLQPVGSGRTLIETTLA